MESGTVGGCWSRKKTARALLLPLRLSAAATPLARAELTWKTPRSALVGRRLRLLRQSRVSARLAPYLGDDE